MIPVRTLILLLSAVMLGAACSVILGTGEQGEDMLLPPPSHHPPYDVYFEGQPHEGWYSVEGGYYAWKNGNTFSLRVIRREDAYSHAQRTLFSGGIFLEQGIITNVARMNVLPPDTIRMGVSDIRFSIGEKDEISGFDFEVQPLAPEYCMLFDLRIDGRLIPEMVYLGQFRNRPDTLPLSVCFR